MKKSLFCVAVVLVVVFAETSYSFDISTWNPIGEAFDTVEEKVPGLFFRGFLRNRTYYCTHGRTHSEGARGIPKRWSYNNIFWEAEFEWRYKVQNAERINVEFVNIWNHQYDAVPDWDTSLALNGNRYTRHYREFWSQNLRELYVNIDAPSCRLRLGKQQVVWGKMEGPLGGYLNKVNPGDMRESSNQDTGDHEWYRIPTWMANITYYVSRASSLQILWIWDFEETRGPFPGTTWQPPTSSGTFPPFFNITGTDKPDQSVFKNHEFMLRYDFFVGGWDMSLVYMYDWSDKPTMFKRGVRLKPGAPPAGPPPARFIVDYQYKHTRQNRFGFAVDKGFSFLGHNAVFRNETIYNTNNYVTSIKDETFDPTVNGVTKRDNLESACALEVFWLDGELLTYADTGITRYFGHNGNEGMWPGKKLEETWLISVFLVKKQWYDDRIDTGVWAYMWWHDGAQKYKAQVSYDVSDFINITLLYTAFQGNSDDIIGRYRNYDHVGLELRYSF
jgi:hypothetical protein